MVSIEVKSFDQNYQNIQNPSNWIFHLLWPEKKVYCDFEKLKCSQNYNKKVITLYAIHNSPSNSPASLSPKSSCVSFLFSHLFFLLRSLSLTLFLLSNSLLNFLLSLFSPSLRISLTIFHVFSLFNVIPLSLSLPRLLSLLRSFYLSLTHPLSLSSLN